MKKVLRNYHNNHLPSLYIWVLILSVKIKPELEVEDDVS